MLAAEITGNFEGALGGPTIFIAHSAIDAEVSNSNNTIVKIVPEVVFVAARAGERI